MKTIQAKPGGPLLTTCLTLLAVVLVAPPAFAQGGTVEERSITVDELERTYFLYVPSDYDGKRPLPLVLNFHGYNSSAELQMTVYSQMNEVAEEYGFIVAYPQGLTVDFLPWDASWVLPPSGPGWIVPGLLEGAQDDVAFAEALIKRIRDDYRVLPQRIHATGWSNGGFFAHRLACVLPHRIASIASVAGPMSDTLLDTCSVEQPVSTMLIHGTADPIVPFGGLPGFIPEVETTPEFWAAQNGCDPTPTATPLADLNPGDGSTVERLAYNGCRGQADVLFYRIDEGGHGWPGTGPASLDFLIGPTNRDIEGSREAWAFFDRENGGNGGNAALSGAASTTDPPETLALHAAYPNPFARSATLDVDLPAATHLTVAVYDVLGRTVAILADGSAEAGRHTLALDASRLPAGAYLVRMTTTEGDTRTQRLTVVR